MVLFLRTLSILVLTTAAFDTFAQTPFTHPLSISDSIPDVQLGNFYYATGPEKSIRDFKGKLIVIDFWDVWCRTCIESMPKLEKLQNKFNNRIQIILITKNNQTAVHKLFARSSIKQPKLPMIVNDTVFSKLFPHTLFPHAVWIDENSIVRQITEGYNTNEANIMAVLKGRTLKMAKKTELKDFDREASLLKEGNGRLLNHMVSYSLILNQINEFGGSSYGEKSDSATNTIGLNIVNMPLLFLFKTAFSNSLLNIEFNEDNRVLLNVKHPENFYYPKKDSLMDSWISHNVFSYESKLPMQQRGFLYKKMQKDLMSTFPYQAEVERRQVKCLVLLRTFKKDISSESKKYKKIRNDTCFIQRNLPVSIFIEELNDANSSRQLPIVDGTNFDKNIDLKINSNLNNISKVKQELKRYGLSLVEQVKEMRMLVINDNN